MLLYNVTVIVDDANADEWLQWMKEFHIPKVMASGKFVSNRLLKVVDSPNEGQTYCVQYVADNLTAYEDYQTNYSPAMQTELQRKFENKLVAFSTLMQYID